MTADTAFFDGVRMLATILANHRGTPAALGDLRDLLQDPDVRREFFNDLASADWITPLRENGYFRSSPKLKQAVGGGVQHPVWPEGQYLVRMALHAPREVASVFAAVETDNVSVVGNLLDAAMAMPPADATKLVPKVVEAAQAGSLWIHFKDASDLCVYLANGGENTAALVLAKALFAPRSGEGEEQLSRRDEYWYKEGLKKVVPILVGRQPRAFIQELCGWLNALVDAKEHVQPDSGSDYSYWWRPAVEEHEQNRDYDLTAVLVGFVRQALEQAIRSDDMSLEQALVIVADYSHLIFKRIRVHLINEFAEQGPALVRQTIMNRELFDDVEYKHEYAMLIGRRLDLLTPEEREQWFEWVDEGPDMSGFDARFRESMGRDPTDEDRVGPMRYWRFEKLHCIRTHLEGQRRAFYEEMLADHGEPELADLNSRISGVWVGHRSAITVDELSRLTFEQAVERVSSWEPPQDQLMGPNVEGLAAALGEYVSKKPQEFSVEAGTLTERPAIYVRTFISQMIAAVKAEKEIDVLAVLRLCHWVLGRPRGERTTSEEGPEEMVDKDWQWTRDEISRLVLAVCEARTEDGPKYPLEPLREPIWRVVEALSRDPTKSYMLHDAAEFDPRTHDYLTEGMNSPRGRAVEAALEYAHWVANHIKELDGQHAAVPDGFASLPEVSKFLEWQMAPDNRSVEANALIGSRIGFIYWIDKDWLAANAAELFHLEGIEETPPVPQGWAAWNAFLVWVRPLIEFYRLFEQQYAYAVKQSALVKSGDQSREQPMNRLGEHLMVLYGRGELRLDEGDGLLNRFLSDASPEYRRHAIGFVGRVLEFEKDLSQGFVDRYQVLWEAYWAGTGEADAREDPDATLFGLWFSSGRFSPDWALARLQEFVEVVPVPAPDHEVIEHLARVASADMATALHILERMVRGDREGWRIQGWIDSARTVLEAGMKAGGDAQRKAEQLIDYLGRRGYTTLGELLNIGEEPR